MVYTATQQVTGMPKKATKDQAQPSNQASASSAPGNASPPGAGLIAALWERMTQVGHSTKDLAQELGITYVYLMALARGEKPIPQVSRDVLKRAADYLGVPVAQTYLLSGALSPEDFVYLPTLDERIEKIREVMSHDAMWCGLALTDEIWAKTPRESRLLICMLYEQAAKTTWLDWTLVPKGTASTVKQAS